MNLQQLSVKLFVRGGARVDQEALIPVLHRWIREQKLDERVLIDVADYRHVHHGPGVMIIAHDAHYGLDEEQGEAGLLYSRKRDEIGDAGDKLRDATVKALAACELLEAEPDLQPLVFGADRLLFRVHSRRAADNSEASFLELRPHLEALAVRLFPGEAVEVAHVGDPRAPLSAELRAAADPGVGALRARL
jgi:hypothetical protein